MPIENTAEKTETLLATQKVANTFFSRSKEMALHRCYKYEYASPRYVRSE